MKWKARKTGGLNLVSRNNCVQCNICKWVENSNENAITLFAFIGVRVRVSAGTYARVWVCVFPITTSTCCHGSILSPHIAGLLRSQNTLFYYTTNRLCTTVGLVESTLSSYFYWVKTKTYDINVNFKSIMKSVVVFIVNNWQLTSLWITS